MALTQLALGKRDGPVVESRENFSLRGHLQIPRPEEPRPGEVPAPGPTEQLEYRMGIIEVTQSSSAPRVVTGWAESSGKHLLEPRPPRAPFSEDEQQSAAPFDEPT